MELKPGIYCIVCKSSKIRSFIKNGKRYFLCENGHKEPRALIIDNKTKSEFVGGKIKHFTVGAVIEKDGKFLLIERINYPFGFAGVAGHIDYGETPEQAVRREIKEESNLEVVSHKLLFHETLEQDKCVLGGDIHEWYLFKCETKGNLKKDDEACKIGWFSGEEIRKLKLEENWKYWFRKLGII